MSYATTSSSYVDPYNACMHTLNFCNTLETLPKTTPLGKCVENYKKEIIQLDTTPTKSGTASYPLSEEATNFIHELLNSEIPLYSEFTLTPSALLKSIHKKCRDIRWAFGTYWDTLMVGSTTPLPGTPLKTDWHNIDLILRVRLPKDNFSSRDGFESLVTDSIHEFISPRPQDSSFIKFKRLDTLGTIITLGDENRSLDLLLWYESDYLPELFTLNALALSFHSLILPNAQQKPLTTISTNDVEATTMVSDRLHHIVRYQPSFKQGAARNLGVFVKLLVCKTKGYLQPQQGLEQLQRAVYLSTRKGTVKVIDDLYNSFKEHLPQTMGAFFAHWMHWMLSLSDSKGIQRPFEPPKHLLPTSLPFFNTLLDFINTNEITPQNFARLLKIVTLIGFLKNQGDTFTLGMWDGSLHLRLKIDHHSYFQFPFEPHEILQNALSFAVSPVTRTLLTKLFRQLNLDQKIEFTALSRYSSTIEEDKHLLDHFLGNLFPPSLVPSNTPPRKKRITPKITLPLDSLLKNSQATSKHIFDTLQLLHDRKEAFKSETPALARLLNRALSNSIPPHPAFSTVLNVLESVLTEISWNETLQKEHQLGTKVITKLGRIHQRTKSPQESQRAIAIAQQITQSTPEASSYKSLMETSGLVAKTSSIKRKLTRQPSQLMKREILIKLTLCAALVSGIVYYYFRFVHHLFASKEVSSSVSQEITTTKYMNRGIELCQFPHQNKWFSSNPLVVDDNGGLRLDELPEVLSMRALELLPNGLYKIILFETSMGHFLCETLTPLCRLLTPEGVARAIELATQANPSLKHFSS